MPWHPIERAALAEALTAAGPGAPTRCEGWDTGRLAAHVVLREGAPLVGAGIVLPWLAGRTEARTRALGDDATRSGDYARLVERVRTGPPAFSPLRWTGDAGYLVELFVHTEDVRRGGPDGFGVPQRTRAPGHDDALWTAVRRMGRLLYRGCGVGVELTDDAGRRARVRPATQVGDVVVHGPPGELVLHAYGRATVAHVTLDGPPAAVTTMRRCRPT